MKKWKKVAIGSAMSTTALVGGCNHILNNAVAPDPIYLQQMGYDPQIMDPDRVIANSRKLHALITSGANDANNDDEEKKTPYVLVKTPPEKWLARQKAFAQEIGDAREISIPAYGMLTIVGKNEQAYELVEKAVFLHNEKYPKTQISMPNFVALGDKGTFYVASDDLVAIDRMALTRANNEEELLAVIGHELEHKAQAMSHVSNGVNESRYYDVLQAADYMGIPVVDDCVKGGLNVGEIINALPSDETVTDPDNQITHTIPTARAQATLLKDAEKWYNHPRKMWDISRKVKRVPACDADIIKLRDSRSAIINDAVIDFLRN